MLQAALSRPLYQVPDGINRWTVRPYQVLSWYPRALYFPNFMSK